MKKEKTVKVKGKVKKKEKKAEPVNNQMPPEIINMVIENYNTAIDQQMEHLHNRFVAYISESKLPVMQVVMVLQILLSEAVEMATKKYVKGD